MVLLDVTAVMEGNSRANSSSNVPGIMVETLDYISENLYSTKSGCSESSLESKMFKLWSAFFMSSAEIKDLYEVVASSKTFRIELTAEITEKITSRISAGSGVMVVAVATANNMAYGKDTETTPAGGGIKLAFIDCSSGSLINDEIVTESSTYNICVPKDDFIQGEWDQPTTSNSTDLDQISTNSTDSNTTALRFLQTTEDNSTETNSTETNSTETSTDSTSTNSTSTETNSTETTGSTVQTVLKIWAGYYSASNDTYLTAGLTVSEVTTDEICFSTTHNTFFSGIASEEAVTNTNTNNTSTNGGLVALVQWAVLLLLAIYLSLF
jgi:hypothetical protein